MDSKSLVTVKTKHDITVTLGWQDSNDEAVVTATALLVHGKQKMEESSKFKKKIQKKNNVADSANVAHYQKVKHE